MKSRIKVASIMLLCAMLLSLVPAAINHSNASAATCDWAQFVTDVTVPDGSIYPPGATFTKTWRLKNIGTCTWTPSYSMVYVSGTQMGSTTSVSMPNNVAPGQSVDISVPMTAPNTAGNYIGYWKFKNPTGALFGIGYYANNPWWVQISVKGDVQTGIAYDFAANAEKAAWSSGAGGLPFPGTDGDPKGFALRVINQKFESGVVAAPAALLVGPQQITNGYIQGSYPAFTVQSGDRFQTTVGCAEGATSCYVAYRLDYAVGGAIRTFWTWREKFEGLTYTANLDLSPLAGQTVQFILYVSSYGSPTGDRALWGNPVILRKGVVPTATPSGATVTPGGPTVTPTPTIATIPPTACDKAAFVADVTVPDGTTMYPGQAFTKTWELKNVGTCAWTSAYQLVFVSGAQMGGPNSANFPLQQGQTVPVGKNVRVSVNLTAPMAAGSYRGYWMFKNPSGQQFGIGTQGTTPWWVDIKVSGPTVTPGGPTATPSATPTGPTPTKPANSAYDFTANACFASWFSGAGGIDCTAGTTNSKGYVLKVANPQLENGTTSNQPGLLTVPQNIQDGYIQGIYPPFKVQAGDRFKALIGCQYGATNCYVGFRLDYQVGSEPIRTFWGPFRERYEGQNYPVDLDLSSLAGKDVKFILTVLALGTPSGDLPLWVGPYIYRIGAGSGAPQQAGTPVPTTAVPTTPTTPVPTTATTPAATISPTAGTPGTPSSYSSTYQNNKYNFKFALPASAYIVSQTDNLGRVSLPLVDTGTNLQEKYILVNATEGKDPCVSTDMEGGTAIVSVNINGNQFSKQTGQGAAAGNQFDWTSFATTHNNACIILAFVLHSTNPGNYSTPPAVFDMAKEAAVIDTVMNTYGSAQ
jgi:hypothetical protein